MLANLARGLALVLGVTTVVLGVLVVLGPLNNPLEGWMLTALIATVAAMTAAFALRGAARGRPRR